MKVTVSVGRIAVLLSVAVWGAGRGDAGALNSRFQIWRIL
jgi:hypothetical protein